MPLAHINMDQRFCWWLSEDAPRADMKNVELPAEQIERFVKLEREYSAMQAVLEHAYRHQQGLPPFSDSPYKP